MTGMSASCFLRHAIEAAFSRFIASLAFHRTMQGLSSSSCPSQNELHLTYNLSHTIQPAKEDLLTIKLVFLPDTRQLATVDLSGPAVEGGDFRELIDTYLQSNDVHGLISAILARARRSWVGLFLMHMFIWVFARSLLWRSVIIGPESRRILTKIDSKPHL